MYDVVDIMHRLRERANKSRGLTKKSSEKTFDSSNNTMLLSLSLGTDSSQVILHLSLLRVVDLLRKTQQLSMGYFPQERSDVFISRNTCGTVAFSPWMSKKGRPADFATCNIVQIRKGGKKKKGERDCFFAHTRKWHAMYASLVCLLANNNKGFTSTTKMERRRKRKGRRGRESSSYYGSPAIVLLTFVWFFACMT